MHSRTGQAHSIDPCPPNLTMADASSSSSSNSFGHVSISNVNDDTALRLRHYPHCHHPHECCCFQPSADAQTIDRLRSFQELEKLYENMSENAYDLSLKDIVDPSYTISGNLKAIVAEGEHTREATTSKAVVRRRCLSLMVMKVMSLGFLTSLPSPQKQSSDEGDKRCSAKPKQLSVEKQLDSEPCSRMEENILKTNANANAFAKSKVHPSNECSTCASYTLFFKHHCLVCGRLYCSNCAKHFMETVVDGEKCKDACSDWPLRKRFSRKVANRCWPFSSPYI